MLRVDAAATTVDPHCIVDRDATIPFVRRPTPSAATASFTFQRARP